MAMHILEVEEQVQERLFHLAGSSDADTVPRCAPNRRNLFDNFIFEATRWAADDGAPDSFAWACAHFQAAHESDSAALGEPVPLVPPSITGHVGSIVSRWQRGQQVDGEWDLPVEEAQLRDELYLRLGTDLGDGLAAAGRRLCSRMWSARVGDGLVLPAVGGHIWNDNSGSDGGDVADVGGPFIAAIYAAGDLMARWRAEPKSRTRIEREIIDLAQTLGWKS
ncbi:hypothetical protein [Rhodococcus sp. NPDC076796]|uniref:hypothetical protein n=1 Tax=Rhodococcus sp. NPDC076796 TaxID=3154859 RepID=UPI00344E275E